MKLIRNNLIPFPDFRATNLFGVLFVRNNAKIDDVTTLEEKYLEYLQAEDAPSKIP